MIDRASVSFVRLRPNAVPTVFEAFPIYLQKKQNHRKPPKERHQISSTTNELPSTSDCNFQSNSVSSPECATSPTKEDLKRKLDHAYKVIEEQKKKIKVLQQKNRRNITKIKNVNDLFNEIKKKNLMEEDALHMLASAVGPNKEIISRQLGKIMKKKCQKSYSPELRAFALTLHFYSSRAYEYVRSTFLCCLPHQRTISKWYQHINGAPGFTEEAINALGIKIRQSSCQLFFSLVIDEMAIRKQVEFDGKEFHGYVNLGPSMNNYSLPIAKEAFAFMLVCINGSWKLPIGYFLVDGLTSAQRANLVQQCLTVLHAVNAKVISLTFDGLAANFAMAEHLGCNLCLNTLKTTFTHPDDPTQEIAVFLDPSHMLKLVRNTFGEKKSIVDDHNEMIDWRYIKCLHELQEKEGIHFANRLRSAHVAFFKQKMKVHLAAQLLSDSVADAIQFCTEVLELPDFAGSQATVRFLRIFNTLFDILNSRSLRQTGLKKALNHNNL